MAGVCFSVAAAQDLDNVGHGFLFSYSALARRSHMEWTFLWYIVPKFPQFRHLILDARSDFANPRFFHCFGDEDMVGQMLKVGRAAHALTVVRSTMETYLIGLRRRLCQPGS